MDNSDSNERSGVSRKPNFLFILIDDMGWRDISCYGSEFYETPNIDRFSRQGMSFTDAYASCPVCSPTRASILTGKYPATVQVTDWIGGPREKGKLLSAPYLHHLPLSEKTLPKTLADNGYRTWHIGKWHLGKAPSTPENHGFQRNIGGCYWGAPRNGYFSPYDIPGLEDGPEGEYLTDRLTNEAIELIQKEDDRPFFMYLSHYAVHTPVETHEHLRRKYEQKARDMGLDKVKTFEEGECFPTTMKKNERVVRRLVQSDPVYAGMIENLDWNVGRVLEALEKSGKAENTVVVFYSDNGGLSSAEGSVTCNAPLSEGKGWMYEGGTREPLILRWPGKIAPGTTCSTPVTSTDFYPTFLEMAGLSLMPKQHCDGESLLPLLTEEGALDRDAIFWHYPHYGNQGGTPASSVRSGDYKLIEFFEDGRLELYNLRQDIGEEHNLAEEKPEIAAELKRRLAQWREKVKAKYPEPNPNFEPWQ